MMPEEIGALLAGHDVVHVGELGWRHLTNGELLSQGEGAGFNALITKDASIPYQQNMLGRTIGLIIVRPKSQDIEDLLALAPDVLRSLSELKPGSVISVGAR